MPRDLHEEIGSVCEVHTVNSVHAVVVMHTRVHRDTTSSGRLAKAMSRH